MPRLSPQERDTVLQLLAERETYESIALRVGCSKPNIQYYADHHKKDIMARRETHDLAIIDRGLRSAAIRVSRMERLAALVEEDLGIRESAPSKTLDLAIAEAKEGRQEPPQDKDAPSPVRGIYGIELKMSASGKTVEQLRFKAEQVAALRGLYDDIAAETGERVKKSELKLDVPPKIYIGVDNDRL